MKKIIIFVLIFLWAIPIYAMNPADYLNKLSNNFTPECYKYYTKINKSKIWNNENERYKTYKININKTADLLITQYGFILPYKYYNSNNDSYNYKNNLNLNNKYLKDYNFNTYEELNSKTQNEIILSFNKILKKGDFTFIFNYKSNNYFAEFYISNDKRIWNLIKKGNIADFDFKYLKIKFISKNKKEYLEKIKIYELNFEKKSNTILVKSFYNDDIEIYSNYSCKEKDFDDFGKNYNNFSIDKNTKILDINLQINPKYNVYTKRDYDNDWVEDSKDNCKYRYNPIQKDSNGDGIGDVCSDVDNDGLIGYYDNCPYVYNPDQKDINRNGVGDVCEFDKDKDGVFDTLDNCINIVNPNQKDSDNDGIGDVCDNCKLYNPRQIDKNNNNIGDVCEQKEKELKKNDKDFDKIEDYIDNCKDISNPNQKDSDNDGIGDVCDNCKDIQNSDQLDINKNGVGDLCEDSDGDSFVGYLDNCINISNSDQKDSDNDGIGDACEDDDHDNILAQNDNCPYDYNPNQKDTDKDGLGDKCDKGDNRFIESNKGVFIGLLIFIVLLFGGGIFFMVKKLNSQ